MNHIVPRATQDFLTRFGGRNPFGKPQWRLLVGSDRLVKESGVYRDWAPGLTTAEKGGLNFGETLAILVVLVSIVLLGWEMLYLFHVLPIHLTPR